MSTQNHKAILPTISEELAPQDEQIVALQTEVEILQAEMALMQKLNHELFQRIQAQE